MMNRTIHKLLRRQAFIHILEDARTRVHGCCLLSCLPLVSLSVLGRSAFSYVVLSIIGLLCYRRVASARVLCKPREHRYEGWVGEFGEGFGSTLEGAVLLSDRSPAQRSIFGSTSATSWWRWLVYRTDCRTPWTSDGLAFPRLEQTA